MIVGMLWLMREIELAALQRGDVVVSEGRGCGAVTINLATGKTDLQQKGAFRTLACTCPTLPCPANAAQAVHLAENGLYDGEYLVRNNAGEPVPNAEVLKELQAHSLRLEELHRLQGVGSPVSVCIALKPHAT